MRYVRVPRELASHEVREEGVCFSPGRYVRFVPPGSGGATSYLPLGKLVMSREESVSVDRGGTYRYAEIGDIDVSTGGVHFRALKGYQLPTNRPARAQTGDILVSTVRTYRKGIGLVVESGSDLVTTNAVLNFCATTDLVRNLPLPYVYAFLRTDFFVEQVWSLLHRGVYPRMDTEALDKILIPIAQNEDVRLYVALLATAIAEKEVAIRARHAAMLQLIDEELERNGAGNGYRYEFPTISDLRATKRLDTGLYCRGFQAFRHRVEQYRHGSTTLSAIGIKSRRGPNLAVSVIGKSLYSDVPKQGWYELIRPVNISEFGTQGAREWLGSAKQLPLVGKGDLILGCEGFEKGRSLVLLDAPVRCTTNFHGTVLSLPGVDDPLEIVFVHSFLAYLRKHGVIDWVGVGGSGGHMSPEYFEHLPFPRFPTAVRRQVARHYHCPAPAGSPPGTSGGFLDWHRARNVSLGIWELDQEMKSLQQELADVQEHIINGSDVHLPW